jgi:hypothetical protein
VREHEEEPLLMRVCRPGIVLAAALLFASAAASAAQQSAAKLPSTEDEMVKVVYRNRRPGLPAEHTDAKPRTLYRVGERWGRLEHPENPVLHPLVIVASPDIWFIDLRKQVARHSLDPGPRHAFRAPIVDRLRPDMPRALLELEFGRELEFMEARGATKHRTKEKSTQPLDVYETELEGIQIAVSTVPDTKQVHSVLVYRDKKVLIAAYLYDEYRRGPAVPALFALPDGIKIVEEAGIEGAKPKAQPETKAKKANKPKK